VNKHTLDIPSRPAGELRAYFEEDQRVIAGHGSSVFEERSVVVKPGDTRWFNSIKTALKDDNGAIIGLVGVMIDLTAVKKAQSSADLAHARLVDAIESLPAAFFLYDADERLVLWNSRVRDFYPDLYAAVRPGMRFEQALRTVMESVNTGEESRDERMRERLAQFRESPGSLEQQMVDGRWLQILDRRTSDGGTVCLRFDVTEAKRQDEARRQSQKLEAIGSLAGGISHDFNNLLTVINSHAEFIVEAAGGQGQLRDDAQMILESGVRAAALTRQLLAFSRKQVLQMQVLDINAVVGNLEKMLRRLIGEDIELGSQLASRLATIRADPTQIEQIVINLTVNSRDAMPKGGKLFIETANRNIDATYCETHPEIKPGDYVMLAVSDNGHGMDQATQARVFEPFFTTKPLGKGTGMGLATVYGIVKQMEGSIFVYSEVGKGTTFKIYFPLSSEVAVESATPGSSAPKAKASETVLLVEDEDLVRKSAARILLGEGYTVLAVTGAEEAIALVATHGKSIDLLLSDVVMPGLSGRELWDCIRKTLPIRVLFMSGYTDDAIVRHGILEGSVPFLSKPFNKLSLLNKVREVLDNPIPDGTFAP
jgi:signal transduction histidine kinase/ActR/RegA family two-component response regulator